MDLQPLRNGTEELISRWLAEKENHQWLDFSGNRVLNPVAVKVMNSRDTHCLLIFAAEQSGSPIGLVAFSDIHPEFRTARLWYVLGDKRYAGNGYTSRAVFELLKLGFSDLGLLSVNAWAVEANTRSISVLRRNGFREIGRQRRCHHIDGRIYDRIQFDLLASEFGG